MRHDLAHRVLGRREEFDSLETTTSRLQSPHRMPVSVHWWLAYCSALLGTGIASEQSVPWLCSKVSFFLICFLRLRNERKEDACEQRSVDKWRLMSSLYLENFENHILELFWKQILDIDNVKFYNCVKSQLEITYILGCVKITNIRK